MAIFPLQLQCFPFRRVYCAGICLQLCLKQLGFTQAVFVLSFVLSVKVGSWLIKYIQYIKRWQLFKSSSFQITFLQLTISFLAIFDIRLCFGAIAVTVVWIQKDSTSLSPKPRAGQPGHEAGVRYALLWFPIYCILLPTWSSYLQCTRVRNFIKGLLKILLHLLPLQNTSKWHQKPERTRKIFLNRVEYVSEKNRGIICKFWRSY